MGEEKQEEKVPAEVEAGIDMSQFRVKVDHFQGVHTLGEEGALAGAPNFRQVPGFPIFGCAQPTEEGFVSVLGKVPGGDTAVRTVWYNMRQEPVVYLDGVPHAPRHQESLHENLTISYPVGELDKLETQFSDVIRERVSSDPEKSVTVNRDSQFTENPLERDNMEERVAVSQVKSMQQVYDDLKKKGPRELVLVRVPVKEEAAPKEDCIDILVDSLKQEPASTQCVFSCQAGQGRTTLGMIIACQVKEIQISTELRNMAEMGLIPRATAEDLIRQKFEFPLAKTGEEEDQYLRGEFDVIKELVAALPGAQEAKLKIDRLIDLCGPSPKGTGVQNLRESIIRTKWKYDVAPEDKQVAWRQMILNFMERYFYLICFATYAGQFGPSGFQKSFVSWMDDHAELRQMIEAGKDKLEWYRQVDPAMFRTLQDMMKEKNYLDKMPTIVKTIYEFAFITYADLPRGPIKNNSMRKLAAKTLLEILPNDVSSKVQERLEEQGANPDFVTLIGLVSFYG